MPISSEEIGFKEPTDFDINSFMEQSEEESILMLFRLEDD